MITLDLDFYWVVVGAITIVLVGHWAFRRGRGLLGR